MSVYCCMRELKWPLFILACVWGRAGGVACSVLLLCNRQWSFLSARGLHASRIRLFLNPTRPHRVGPPCSFTDGPPLGWVPRLGRFHACVLIETVCELLHAITESRASGGSLSLELFCRSNFIHQTQVYFPPPRDFARSLHTSALTSRVSLVDVLLPLLKMSWNADCEINVAFLLLKCCIGSTFSDDDYFFERDVLLSYASTSQYCEEICHICFAV